MTPRLPLPVLSIQGLLLTATLLCCTVLPARAENAFQGFSLGAQASAMKASSKVTISEGSDKTPYKMDDSSQAITWQAGYNLGLGERFVLGLSGSYRSGVTPAGSSPVGEDIPLDVELSDMRIFSVEPGYALSPHTLVYGKFAYSSVRADIVVEAKDSKFGTTLKGAGFGAGLRHLLTPYLYVQVEFLQLDYASKTLSVPDEHEVRLPVKASTTSASIGLSFLF
jgi:opacity protein-like surface antigen